MYKGFELREMLGKNMVIILSKEAYWTRMLNYERN